VASHRAVEQWKSLSASYPQPSSSYTDPQGGNLCWRSAERRQIGESHRPPRGDDGGCTRLTVAWRCVPDESDDTDAGLPQVERAHGPRRSGAWARGGPFVAVGKRHELQAPKPDHHGQREQTFGVSHLEKWRENDVGTMSPAGVLSQ
jgi:hypothetical protein